jgi:hypothetical protein
VRDSAYGSRTGIRRRTYIAAAISAASPSCASIHGSGVCRVYDHSDRRWPW